MNFVEKGGFDCQGEAFSESKFLGLKNLITSIGVILFLFGGSR